MPRRRPALQARDTQPEAPSSKRWSQSGDGDGDPTLVRGPVLVVAPDRFSTATLARALLRESFSVRSATDAAELLIAAEEGTPIAVVLAERTTIEMPRPLSSLFHQSPDVVVVVHGCVRAGLAEAMVRALGAQRVIGLEGNAEIDIVSALRAFFPE